MFYITMLHVLFYGCLGGAKTLQKDLCKFQLHEDLNCNLGDAHIYLRTFHQFLMSFLCFTCIWEVGVK